MEVGHPADAARAALMAPSGALQSDWLGPAPNTKPQLGPAMMFAKAWVDARAQYLQLQADLQVGLRRSGHSWHMPSAVAHALQDTMRTVWTPAAAMPGPCTRWLPPLASHCVPACATEEDHTDSTDACELAGAMQQQGRLGQQGTVRAPAIVTEYMAQGSLKGALSRKAEIVQGALIRVIIALDAAKVGARLSALQQWRCSMPGCGVGASKGGGEDVSLGTGLLCFPGRRNAARAPHMGHHLALLGCWRAAFPALALALGCLDATT